MLFSKAVAIIMFCRKGHWRLNCIAHMYSPCPVILTFSFCSSFDCKWERKVHLGNFRSSLSLFSSTCTTSWHSGGLSENMNQYSWPFIVPFHTKCEGSLTIEIVHTEKSSQGIPHQVVFFNTQFGHMHGQNPSWRSKSSWRYFARSPLLLTTVPALF